MAKTEHITALIDEWKPRRLLADAVGVSVERVHKWAAFNRIPLSHQGAVLQAARDKGLKHVTAEWMVLHNSGERERAKGAA